MPLTIVNSIIYYNKNRKFKKLLEVVRNFGGSAITKKEKTLNAYVFKAFL
jgi:hypothetical protein